MPKINKQCVCVKFCFEHSKNAMETYKMMKTDLEYDSLVKCFKKSRKSTEDYPRSGRPLTSRNDIVSKICGSVK